MGIEQKYLVTERLIGRETDVTNYKLQNNLKNCCAGCAFKIISEAKSDMYRWSCTNDRADSPSIIYWNGICDLYKPQKKEYWRD